MPIGEESEDVNSGSINSICVVQHGFPSTTKPVHHKTLCQLLTQRIDTDIGNEQQVKKGEIIKASIEENNNVALDLKNDSRERMNKNNNGFSRMTGSAPHNSSENINWLNDGSSNQSSPPRPSEGMISNVSSIGSESLSTTMLASAASPGNMSGVFRPPLNETTSRLLTHGNSQYPSLYSTGGSASSSISPYSLQGHSPSTVQGPHLQSLAHYNTYYQHPYNLQRSGILTGPYPQIESYSAVLQSMGTVVQQTSHTQIPRNTYGPVTQYSGLSSSHPRSMSASVSPSPDAHHGASQPEMSLTEMKREKLQEEHDMLSRLKDERAQSLSSIEFSGGKSVSFKDPPRRESHREASYKVPSGKEGSLKHRILTRPSDSAIQSSHLDSRFSTYTGDEPALKRSKNNHGGVSTKHSMDEGPNVHSMMPQSSMRQSPAMTQGSGPQLHYPPHFMKGSIIQLSNGELKRVEDLQTDDFVQSAEISSDLKIDSSTVVKIEFNPDHSTAILGFVVGEHKVQVTVEATLEHPFFVFGQGWSSCEPDRSLHRYGLDCQKLSVGDVCISLTHKDVQERAAEISQQQQQELKDSPHRSSLRNSTSMLSPAHKRSSPNDPEGRPRKHHLSSMSSPKDNVEIKQENPHYSVT
ncbi:uncharacterized protein LOC125666259 isoform X1 [Ostrea edulis]|uniref:uncharacterized protein LOC125666259 isoform X1 n=2 Tax=Ostrea edulis TaxID=37623 RepID=UPI0020941F86|nr:uncharacterized protein LOC125666259 isoform X1 [Ostrea edulis]XP_048755434.1 uncharacterized protein LOC125666259 isoform X1 [Ostrea edulis]XP_048755435.1 uncharacterized protein LOC125666259 isoform X1 [Ostrea edulis]